MMDFLNSTANLATLSFNKIEFTCKTCKRTMILTCSHQIDKPIYITIMCCDDARVIAGCTICFGARIMLLASYPEHREYSDNYKDIITVTIDLEEG